MTNIEDDRSTIAHIGDSRCYLIRSGHYDYDDINNTAKNHVVYQTKDYVHKDCRWVNDFKKFLPVQTRESRS